VPRLDLEYAENGLVQAGLGEAPAQHRFLDGVGDGQLPLQGPRGYQHVAAGLEGQDGEVSQVGDGAGGLGRPGLRLDRPRQHRAGHLQIVADDQTRETQPFAQETVDDGGRQRRRQVGVVDGGEHVRHHHALGPGGEGGLERRKVGGGELGLAGFGYHRFPVGVAARATVAGEVLDHRYQSRILICLGHDGHVVGDYRGIAAVAAAVEERLRVRDHVGDRGEVHVDSLRQETFGRLGSNSTYLQERRLLSQSPCGREPGHPLPDALHGPTLLVDGYEEADAVPGGQSRCLQVSGERGQLFRAGHVAPQEQQPARGPLRHESLRGRDEPGALKAQQKGLGRLLAQCHLPEDGLLRAGESGRRRAGRDWRCRTGRSFGCVVRGGLSRGAAGRGGRGRLLGGRSATGRRRE